MYIQDSKKKQTEEIDLQPMKNLKPIAILALLPAPLASLVIPLFCSSPPPSPTEITAPPPAKSNNSKRNPLSPSSVIDEIIHRARPPDDPGADGSHPLVTAKPNSALDGFDIDTDALKKAISGGGSDGTSDHDAAGPPEKPAGLEEMEFKKNTIRL
ncbi:hypothetical protein TWF788_007287 [Orbilia oligospora]|uniref:Uncharacterized protein n=1 Tax=Orbilia oligospora TaxID=2813651 RepID=A0A7C8U1H7_ORBOL|nr:hypothetical protein TWF788_007287 [Orbilia oligospora]